MENCTPFIQRNCQNTIVGSSRISFHSFNSIFQGSGFSFQFLKNYHNLTIFKVILNFAQECYYLENKVGVVDFTKARGLVKFQSPRALAGPWALKHYQPLNVCKIYYSYFIFEVMYHYFSLLKVSKI